MLIYGEEKQVSRFLKFGETNMQIRDVLSREHQILSEVDRLKKLSDPQTEILVLDTTDMSVLRFLYQKGWQQVC